MATVLGSSMAVASRNNYSEKENEKTQKSFTNNTIVPLKNVIKNEINSIINSRIKRKFSTSLEIIVDRNDSYYAFINYLKSIDKKIAKSIIPSYDPEFSTLNRVRSYIMINTNIPIYVNLGNGVILKIEFISGSSNNPVMVLLMFYGPVYKTLKYKEVQFINGLAKVSKKYMLKNDLVIRKTIFNVNKMTGEVNYRNDMVDKLRRFKSIFCNDRSTLDKLNTFLDNFISKYDKFTKYDLSYKTGIMIHGLPGTGKTSLAFAIACELRYKIGNLHNNVTRLPRISYINMLNIKECIDILKEAIPDGEINIIVLEDIDYIFGKREDTITPEEKQNANDLLQLLDGYLSINNSICIATTNYYDKLDSALIRPGRFDLTIEMDYLEKPAATDMCKYYEVDPEKVFKEVESFPVSPAYLQSIIIKYM